MLIYFHKPEITENNNTLWPEIIILPQKQLIICSYFIAFTETDLLTSKDNFRCLLLVVGSHRVGVYKENCVSC